MGSPGIHPGSIRFGPFALDANSRELRKHGYLVKLQPQQFAVLLLLTERAGQVVSREEIHQHIWGKDTFVDFERGINFSINQIRAALGDDADKPRYVETIPRRGYRFVGRLEQEFIPKQSDAPALEETGSRLRRRFRLSFVLPVAFALVCLFLFLLWNWRPRKTSATNGRRAVAVVDIQNHSQDPSLDWLGDGVVDLLTTDLAQAKNLDVISSERVRNLIGREGKPGQGLPGGQARDVAQKAGADIFLSGGILRMGEGYRLDLRVQDTGSGKVLLSEKVEGESPQAIFSMVDETTDRIVSQISPGEVMVRPGAAKLTSNLNALRAYEDGLSYKSRYIWDQAAASFRRATELDPQFAMAYYHMATLLTSYSEKREALTRAALAAERRGLPEHQRMLIRARQLRFDGRFDEAIQTLQTIVRRFPKEVEPRIRLGLLLRERGGIAESAAMLEEAARLDDFKESVIWNELGYTYAYQGDLTRGLDAVDKYAALLPPNDINPIDSRADIYAISGHLDKAIAEYKRSVASQPDASDARGKLALGYLLAGRNHEAEEAGRTAYQKAGGAFDRALARNVQGDVAVGRGGLALAEKYYQQSARLYGNDQPLLARAELWKAAEIDFEQRRPRDALALGKRTPGPAAAEVRGVAYLLLNKSAEAEQEFSSARGAMAPYFSDYLIEKFIAFDRLQAASYANQWHQLVAGWPELPGNMKRQQAFFPGRAYAELAVFPEAEAELRTSLRLIDPQNLIVSSSDFFCGLLTQFYLGKVLEQQGRKADAINSYREFLSHFEQSSARLPQISEARVALGRLE